MPCDPTCEREGQWRQERAVGPDSVADRSDLPGSGEVRGRTEDHTERLAPSESDQDGLAVLEIGEPVRHRVGVRPSTSGPRGVDGHLDKPDPASPNGRGRPARGELGLEPEGHVDLDADPPARVCRAFLGDDRVDPIGGPPHLTGLIDDDVVVVVLARKLDRRVALADLEFVCRLGRA